MKLFKHQFSALTGSSSAQAPNSQRGAALMLSFLVLIILIMIVQQIKYSSDAESRVSRNVESIALMDQAIESVLLQAVEDLRADGEAAAEDEGGGEGGGGGGLPGGSSPDGGEEESAGPTDSKEDAWAQPQRTELNGMQLRIFIVDEDSKFNLLSLMNEDEEQAERAYEALVRILETCRADTDAEIPGSDARAMAGAMREFMANRDDQYVPRPSLSSFDEDKPDFGMPQSLRDFAAIDPSLFPENLFVDYRDGDDNQVHSIASFLTVFSCMTTLADSGGDAGGGGGEGGTTPPASSPGGSGGADGRVNVNTAPPAVLNSLMDPRDVSYDFWEDVIEYRNESDEESEDLDPDDIPLDEFGEEQITRQFFDSFEGLSEMDAWEGFTEEVKAELEGKLKVSSSVFSIYITARKLTGSEDLDAGARPDEVERQEEESAGLVRTVRCVIWRQESEGGDAVIIPLIRWEVLNYIPHNVLDYPDDEER
jgi:hypothetical protein